MDVRRLLARRHDGPGKDEVDQQVQGDLQAEWCFSAPAARPLRGLHVQPTVPVLAMDDVRAVVAAAREAMRPQEGKNDLTRRWIIRGD